MTIRILLGSLIAGLTLLTATGCQTTEAQTINLHQPEWAADHYEKGIAAWHRGDKKLAVRQFKDAYTFSDARAQAMLGIAYLQGTEVFQNAEVARAYAIAADQRPDFDAFAFYHQRWQTLAEADSAYLIAWVLANRFSGKARQDYETWIRKAAETGHLEARKDLAKYIN
jgi:TPR repeat protein